MGGATTDLIISRMIQTTRFYGPQNLKLEILLPVMTNKPNKLNFSFFILDFELVKQFLQGIFGLCVCAGPNSDSKFIEFGTLILLQLSSCVKVFFHSKRGLSQIFY